MNINNEEQLQKFDALQIKEPIFMRIASNSKISRHDGFKLTFSGFGIKINKFRYLEDNNWNTWRKISKFFCYLRKLKLLSACKPKLSFLSIALNVKLFLDSNEQSLKMERAGIDFGTLIAIIIWVTDDAEHDYETTRITKLKRDQRLLLEVIHTL